MGLGCKFKKFELVFDGKWNNDDKRLLNTNSIHCICANFATQNLILSMLSVSEVQAQIRDVKD